MVMQAYIDESYEPDGVFVLGGYISTEEKWASFSIEWEKLLRRFGVLKVGASHYHFKYNEMVSIPERRERIPIFEKAVKRHAVMALSCRIHIKEMRRAQNRIQVHGQTVDFTEFSNPYLMAFRCLMDKFHNNRHVYEEFVGPDEKIDFIFDDQIHDKKAILREWDNYITNRDEHVRKLYGETPQFKSDDECFPLQAADLWAGMVREAYKNGGIKKNLDLIPAAQGGDDDTTIPCLVMEWNEEDFVADYIKMARNLTNQPVYDIQWRNIDI